MIYRLIEKLTLTKIIILFVTFSVAVSNILTAIIMSFVPDPMLVLAHSLATVVSLSASVIVSFPSAKLYKDMLAAKLEAMENYKIDSLTNLHSRKPFLEDMTELLHNNRSQSISLLFVIIDLDHFKKVNDTYGHLGGDAVMTRVGEILKSITRESDLVGRFGGEEFVLAISDIHLNDVHVIAEKIRKSLDTRIQYQGQTIHFTASVGCLYLKSSNQNLNTILRIADEQLYKAKDNGRNRYEIICQ